MMGKHECSIDIYDDEDLKQGRFQITSDNYCELLEKLQRLLR